MQEEEEEEEEEEGEGLGGADSVRTCDPYRPANMYSKTHTNTHTHMQTPCALRTISAGRQTD